MPVPRTSIHRKLSYVVLATTACALLITAAVLLLNITARVLASWSSFKP